MVKKNLIFGIFLGVVGIGLLTIGTLTSLKSTSKKTLNENKEVKIHPVTDSKVKYFEFRGRKMYLSNDLEEFTMQFKGLKCKGSFPGGNIKSEFEIDKIDSKDHAFYKIYPDDSDDFKITCPIEGVDFDNDSSQDKQAFVKIKATGWDLVSMAEALKIKFDNQFITLGLDNNIKKEKVDYIDSIIKKLGEPEQKDVSIVYNGQVENFEYEDNKYTYFFNVMNGISKDEGKEVYKIGIWEL